MIYPSHDDLVYLAGLVDAWAQHSPQSDKQPLSDEVPALRRGHYLASRFLNQRGAPANA